MGGSYFTTTDKSEGSLTISEVMRVKALIKRFQVGACSAAVFGNEVETAKGKVVQKHIVLQRSYRDKDGNFQNSGSFGINDVPKAMLALQEAYRFVLLDGMQQTSQDSNLNYSG